MVNDEYYPLIIRISSNNNNNNNNNSNRNSNSSSIYKDKYKDKDNDRTIGTDIIKAYKRQRKKPN